jgi:hypothetical protein
VRRPVIVVLVAALALLGGACSKDKAVRDGGEITKAGPISVFDLRPGDCLMPDDKTVGEVEKINAVPCEENHTQEVYALPEYPDDENGGVYPGEDAIKKFADASCLDAFGDYTGTDYLNSNLFFTYLLPSLDSWNSGDDRQILCVIVSPSEDGMTGTVRGTTTTTRKGQLPTTSSTKPGATTTTTASAAPTTTAAP